MTQNIMTSWKKLIPSVILSRGLVYYQSGLVQTLKNDSEDHYIAKVAGTKTYYVSLTVGQGRILSGYCSCPYAQDNKYCKHMAAVMYAIDEKYGNEAFGSTPVVEKKTFSKLPDIKRKTTSSNKSAPKKSTEDESVSSVSKAVFEPFVTLEFNDDDKVHYLNFGNSLEVYKPRMSAYKEAQNLLMNNCVSLSSATVDKGRNSEKYLSYEVTINEENKQYPNAVQIIIGHKGIIEILCKEDNKWAYNSWRSYISHISHQSILCDTNEPNSDGIIELCAHKTAAILHLIDYLKKNRDNVDFSNPEAINLIKYFQKERSIVITKNQLEDAPVIDIEPTILRERDNQLLLTLKIQADNGKYYKVRDIDKLCKAIENGSSYLVSSHGYVNFSQVRLSDRAKKIIKIKKVFKENYLYGTKNYYSDKAEFSLLGILDEFFDIMKNTPIILDTKPLLGFKEVDPTFNMRLEIERENTQIVGVQITGNISGRYESFSNVYWFQNDYMLKAPKRKLGSATQLFKLTNTTGKFSFLVGLKYIDQFYQEILPDLRRYGKIEDNAIDYLENILKEAPKAIFYLDYDKGNINCSSSFRYIGEERPIYSCSPNGIIRHSSECVEFQKDIEFLLSSYFLSDYKTGNWYISDDNNIFSFLNEGLNTLFATGEVNVTDKFKRLLIRKMPQINSSIEIDEKDDSILDFELDLQGFSIDELVEILQSYKNKKKFHRLKNGDFVSFDDINLDSLTSLFLSSGIDIKQFVDGKLHLPLYRALYLEQILDEKKGISYEAGQKFRKLLKEFKTIKESDYKVPSSLDNTMRSYQKDGYKWMKVLYEYGFGGILADDMGLGKTVQALSLLQSIKEEINESETNQDTSNHTFTKNISALIVCPASLVYNWKAEVAKFTPDLNAVCVAGNNIEREKVIDNYLQYDILITSYDLLKRDIAAYQNITFDIQIIDEAQFIKNHNTAAAKAVRAISAKRRFALTGTPIENRLIELWSIFEYLMPGFLFNQENFKCLIANPIEKNSDTEASSRLKKLTGPFILRRLKTDVLKDLPEKIEETRIVPLEGEQLKLYTAEVAMAQGMLKDAKNYNQKKIEILAELMKIRQICCDPSLVFSNYMGESAKKEAALDLIKSAIDSGHKILLFSQFTSMLELLEKEIKESKIDYYKITGETGKAKRLELVDSFNKDSTPLFLISLKAGGTGLNLTAADIVIHYDPWWNIAVQNQATDRAHRIGQTKRVTVYKIIAENTIEEKIVKLQETKMNLANEIVSTENISLSTLSQEDLIDLLSISNIAL